ncbi:MAG: hypothetical protein ACRD0K_20780 [Egibacteraceae bacterium]
MTLIRQALCWVIVACLLLLVSGCALSPAVPDAVYVRVPVPCIEKPIARPALALDNTPLDAASLNDYRLLMKLYQERLERQAYERELEGQVAGCSTIQR